MGAEPPGGSKWPKAERLLLTASRKRTPILARRSAVSDPERPFTATAPRVGRSDLARWGLPPRHFIERSTSYCSKGLPDFDSLLARGQYLRPVELVGRPKNLTQQGRTVLLFSEHVVWVVSPLRRMRLARPAMKLT
jgi:hypothetical protein